MMNTKVVQCRVCGAGVPRRKTYSPTICEACQKFFQRYCRDPSKLQCATGTGFCDISGKVNRYCHYCRYQKCRAIGMKSKYMRSSESSKQEQNNPTEMQDDSRNSTEATSSVECSVISATHVASYDGQLVEQFMRLSYQAYIELNALQFTALRKPLTVLSHRSNLLDLATEQIAQSKQIHLAYANHFSGFVGEELAKVLGIGSMLSMGTCYHDLRGNPGASYFGVGDALMPQVMEWYPIIRKLKISCDRISVALDQWNPTIIEVSLLMCYLFFNEAIVNTPQLHEVRKLVLHCFNLQVSYQNNGDSCAVDTRQRRFVKCIQLIKDAVTDLLRCIPLDNEQPYSRSIISVLQGSEVTA